jgi:hypothetical protein
MSRASVRLFLYISNMPLGTVHTIDGLMLTGRPYPLLRPDTGGIWRLDLPHKFHILIGRRVRVEGTRSGFDMLDVRSVTAL